MGKVNIMKKKIILIFTTVVVMVVILIWGKLIFIRTALELHSGVEITQVAYVDQDNIEGQITISYDNIDYQVTLHKMDMKSFLPDGGVNLYVLNNNRVAVYYLEKSDDGETSEAYSVYLPFNELLSFGDIMNVDVNSFSELKKNIAKIDSFIKNLPDDEFVHYKVNDHLDVWLRRTDYKKEGPTGLYESLPEDIK